MQGGMDQRGLLVVVDLGDAGCRRGRGSAARVEYLATATQRFLQAMADLVPGSLILGLFLAPDDLAGVGVTMQRGLVLLTREGIELLDTHERDVAQTILAAGLQQVEVHLAAAE